MSLSFLDAGLNAHALSDIDVHFARFLAGNAKQASPEIALASALLSRASAEGHVYLDLRKAAEQSLWEDCDAPGYESWREALQRSGLLSSEDSPAPLVLEGGRLYLQRYWRYEKQVAAHLRAVAVRSANTIDRLALAEALRRWFPRGMQFADGEIDWQQAAAALAVLKPFAVISGGPGTGKTSTVLRVLAILAELSPQPLRMALAAPTGKAAARLQEALRLGRQSLALPPAIENQLPHEAATLHRLLGYIPGRIDFRHHCDNPLPLDVLVIDEASMIDLALMAKMLDALRPDARLLMLGDKDQLASVEAGAVMSSLCAHAEGYSAAMAKDLKVLTGHDFPIENSTTALSDNCVVLRKRYRFKETGGIGALADAALKGEVVRDFTQSETVEWSDADRNAEMIGTFVERYIGLLQAAQERMAPVDALSLVKRFAVLCAHRDGAYGAARINEAIQAVLRRRAGLSGAGQWYPGRLVMMSRNDYGLRLFNGEVGLTLYDDESRLAVFFPAADGGLKRYPVARISACESAFAMTVHKAQGSEFEEVALVLPRTISPVLSRELFYTAITRASRKVHVYGGEEIARAALARQTERDSALAERLR